jgi:capsular exopolysaccharide synthesis family protein
MNWGLYLHLARRWTLAAIIPTMIVASLAYLYTKHEPKQYQTTAILYVQVPQTGGSTPGGTDVYSSEALIPTYSAMISSPVIAARVDRAMASTYPGYHLGNHGIKVDAGGAASGTVQTQLMDVTVGDTIPARAAAAANTVAHVFTKYAAKLMKANFKDEGRALQAQLNQAQVNLQIVSDRIANYHGDPAGLNSLKASFTAYQSIYQTLISSLQQFNLTKDTLLNGVKVFSPAGIPGGPIGPHPTRNALLFGFLALMVCAAGIFLYDYFDDTPRTPEEVEETVGAPVLGTVQQFDPAKYGTVLVTAKRARSPLSEAYRVIRTNIQFTDVDKEPRTIVVTSASPAEGKSTTVSNLANVFAESGRRVTLIDGDLRRPSLHRIFSTDRTEGDGLTKLLVSKEMLNGHGAIWKEQPNLRLIASGPLPPRPADVLGSDRMRELVEHFSHESQMVLIDSPPILAVTDATILSTICDGVILVVDPARSKRRDLNRARESIEAVGGKILGIVINRLNRRGSSYYYYYYNHHYGYQYKYRYGQSQETGQPELEEAQT